MRILKSFIIGFIGICFMITYASGQKTYLKVIDKKTNQAVLYAHVCFEGIGNNYQHYEITNDEGKVPNEAKTRTQVAISFVGYTTLIDTINPGVDLTFYLEPEIYNIDEVVITAQYTPQKADQSIYKVKVINFKQINERGAANLNDVLSNELNIRINQDAVLGSKMMVQGLGGENVKILIDGVPVIGRMDGNIDLNQLNLHNVDHIEIVEGPMSVIYGSNALAGAINLITKENQFKKLKTVINSYYESAGHYNTDIGFTFNRKGHILSIAGARNFFDGFSENNNSRSYQWKPKRQYNLDGYYVYDKNGFKFKYAVTYFDELLKDKGNLLPPYYEKAFDIDFNTKRLSNRLIISKKISKDQFINITNAYSSYSRAKTTIFKDLTTLEEHVTTNPSDHDTTTFTAWLFRGTYSKENKEKPFNYQIGYDINLESGSGKRMLDTEQDIFDYAGFLSFQYKFSDNLIVQPGIRYIYNTKYDAPVVNTLNLKWKLKKKLNLRASYARGFRAPSLKELYLDFVDVNHNIQGNQDLKAEYAHYFNVSGIYNLDSDKNFYGFEVSLFYSQHENIIQLVDRGNLIYSYINVAHNETVGWNLIFFYKLHPHFNFRLGLTENGTYSSFNKSSHQLNDFAFSTDVNTNLNYKWIKYGLNFSLLYKYTGQLPQFYIDENDEISEGFIRDYQIMDMTVSRNFWKNRILLVAGSKNIFNIINIATGTVSGGAHTSSGGSTPIGMGRTFFVKFGLNIQKF